MDLEAGEVMALASMAAMDHQEAEAIEAASEDVPEDMHPIECLSMQIAGLTESQITHHILSGSDYRN